MKCICREICDGWWSLYDREAGVELAFAYRVKDTLLWTARLNHKMCGEGVTFLAYTADTPERAFDGLLDENLRYSRDIAREVSEIRDALREALAVPSDILAAI
jgi:hypothetical protein